MKYLKTLKSFFQIPKTPNETKNESSLLELFLDLIWVAILGGGVHQAVHIIEHNLESGTTMDYFSLFYVIFEIIFVIFLWKTITYYNSRYEENTIRHRLITMFLMIGLVLLTSGIFIDINHNWENFGILSSINAIGFVIIFTTLAFALSTLLLNKERNLYEKKLIFRNLNGLLIPGLIIVPGFCIVISNYLGVMGNETEIINNLKWTFLFPSWIIALLAWIVLDWFSISSKILLNIKDFSHHHIKDRQNVIFIVFIGEVVIQIVGSSEYFNDFTENVSFLFRGIFLVLSCFIIMFLWWWIFNDTVNFPEISDNPRKFNSYSFFGLLILISLIFHAIGFSTLIKSFFEQHENKQLSSDLGFWGKMFVAIGILMGSSGQTGMSFCIKDYKKSSGTIFKGVYKFVTLPGFITFGLFFSFSFVPQISQAIFLIILFVFNVTFVLSLVLLSPKYSNFKKEEIDQLIAKDDKKIFNNFKKYLDLNVHAKHNFKLNYYSKFISEKDKKLFSNKSKGLKLIY